MSESNKKTCFVISPIGEEGSETRRRADQVLTHIIAPVVEDRGFRALRADAISKPGMITSQIIQHIVEDPLVVADLSEENANVFYELAIRHAIRKPFVQLMQKGEKVPFDVGGMRTVFLDERDLDSVAEAKREIGEQIDSLLSDPTDLETPISVTFDLQELRRSGSPSDRAYAEVVSVVSAIHSDVRKNISLIETLGRLIVTGQGTGRFQRTAAPFRPAINLWPIPVPEPLIGPSLLDAAKGRQAEHPEQDERLPDEVENED